MKKTSIALGVMAVVGVIVGGVQSLKEPVLEARAAKEYRLALLDETCPTSTAKCDHKYKVKGDMCMCMTDDTGDQPGEIKNINTLPVDRHFKYLVCEEMTDKTNRIARWFRINDPPPTGWTCETIHAKGIKEKSVRNAEGELLKSLKQRCCASCSGDCFVSPGEWGMCPYCRLDNNCKDFCP